ncbi:alpha/beta fold hydrolase [Parahaliea sp. F7430]|uniref:Alpha/beta fold hydrolase n=1 Tax=Sediminihaliea albiluteola TaxID=2758564 RepID=A0A7W2TUW8_9GAMM|nr:alpha/beta fold hydrolase [Sediminihaliea albiluteola]MBA6412404.1 alpha/beta fold hydrolase [Sediminihaliea albiluteola]
MSTLDAARPCHWQIDGLSLHGLEWGEPGGQAVLALHGWLDNAASFARLAAQLRGCHVVAIDLSGHGLSSDRSADASYQIWDDLPQLQGLLDALGWEQVALLGHSRGAIISSLLAAALPERVSHLVLLDGMIPEAIEPADFAQQMGRFLLERKSSMNRPPRRYPDYASALAARTRHGLAEPAARLLAERSLQGSDTEGWMWRNDPRLRGASAVKLTQQEIDSVLAAIEAPVLLMLATAGMMKSHANTMLDLAAAKLKRLHLEHVEGGHHFHMEPVIDARVDSILAFLKEH